MGINIICKNVWCNLKRFRVISRKWTRGFVASRVNRDGKMCTWIGTCTSTTSEFCQSREEQRSTLCTVKKLFNPYENIYVTLKRSLYFLSLIAFFVCVIVVRYQKIFYIYRYKYVIYVLTLFMYFIFAREDKKWILKLIRISINLDFILFLIINIKLYIILEIYLKKLLYFERNISEKF